MDVHTYVNIRNKVATRKTFKLFTFDKRVNGTDNNVAILQSVRCIVPSIFYGDDAGFLEKTSDLPFGNCYLAGCCCEIDQGAANQSVCVCIGDVVWINYDVSANPEMSGLLNDMRPTSPKPDETKGCLGKY